MKNIIKSKHGRLISSTSKQIRLFISRRMNEENYNIHESQLFVLLDVMHFPGTSLKEVGHRLGNDKTSITKSVKKLSELNFIETVVDTRDKRIIRLYVKDEANNIIPKIHSILKEMRSQLYNGFSENEIDEINSLMQRAHLNMLMANGEDID